ncbi:MAG: hypothetical protein WC961_07405 [Anaerovoracaceae bacterium]
MTACVATVDGMVSVFIYGLKERIKKVLKDHREAIERIIIKNNAQ